MKRMPAQGPMRWGCRSPLGFLLVMAVSVLVCCTLGLAGGAIIGELGAGSWLWPRGETQPMPGRIGPVSLIDRPPTRTPTPIPTPPSITPLPTVGRSQQPAPPLAPLAGDDAGRMPPPSEEVITAPALHAAAAAVALPVNQPSRPATRLAIPSLGVDVPVVLIGFENGTWPVDQLTYAAGHLQGTASPGAPGNVAIAGHVTLARGGDGPFRNLAQLRQGDEVVVYVDDAAYRYRVVEVRIVLPEEVSVTAPTAEPQLTLITCANWNRDRRAYDQRIVAIARLVS
jgi:sortase A